MLTSLARYLEYEVIPACRRYSIEVVAYNPPADGILSGKYKTAEIPKEDGTAMCTHPDSYTAIDTSSKPRLML